MAVSPPLPLKMFWSTTKRESWQTPLLDLTSEPTVREEMDPASSSKHRGRSGRKKGAGDPLDNLASRVSSKLEERVQFP